jgi:uncharacterized protein YecT (DUF1311 family)
MNSPCPLHHLLLTALLLLPVCATGQSDTKHPIDHWLEQAIETNSSTLGMRESLNQAREKWDAEMNACYKRLLAKLPAEKQGILRDAQRAWLAFRDADGKAIGALVSSRQGTMFQLLGTDYTYQRVRDRALQLLAYENAISQ